ncbi:hypothetical protein SDC9_162552 [bioreactor metagenome]|uniref:Uncharacterized protein n=1 Tax=bioreactor metagenome TaxID=1076179 RepID=A0A645FNR5_9ZZZZ
MLSASDPMNSSIAAPGQWKNLLQTPTRMIISAAPPRIFVRVSFLLSDVLILEITMDGMSTKMNRTNPSKSNIDAPG